ncbi:hypothetical protein [Phaffia rhodozyma]|uniref:Uncharacterized protein n=1 Tax=Phaffia rhodozyma TaxID=264483 RepID=A0A0F7SR45_PHARH|nr:hypothetical protein [Phaffia rhodozyma]
MSVLSSPVIMATIALLVTNVAHGLPMNDQPLVRAYSDLDPAPDVPTTESRSGSDGGSKVSSTTIIVVAVILGVLVTLGVGGMMSMLDRNLQGFMIQESHNRSTRSPSSFNGFLCSNQLRFHPYPLFRP